MTGNLTGVVLAGGRSSRMGEDKALLPWHGRPLLGHMCDLLEAAGATAVRVSGDRPGYAGIPDRWPDRGPLGGLASVADELDDGELLVVPVDMPLLTVSLLHALVANTDRACTRLAGAMLPMRWRLDTRSRAILAGMIERPGSACSVRALQQAIGVTELPVAPSDAARLVNCNTPSEWREVNE
jgi:molybdopterin-guanine dinucleotide biosynthesis protein A